MWHVGPRCPCRKQDRSERWWCVQQVSGGWGRANHERLQGNSTCVSVFFIYRLFPQRDFYFLANVVRGRIFVLLNFTMICCFFPFFHTWIGGRDLRRMFRQATTQRFGGVLLCTEGCSPPNSATIWLSGACSEAGMCWCSTAHFQLMRSRQGWCTGWCWAERIPGRRHRHHAYVCAFTFQDDGIK